MNRMRNMLLVTGLTGMIFTAHAFGACGNCPSDKSKDTESKAPKGECGCKGGMKGGGCGMMNMACMRIISDAKLAAELGITEAQIKTIKDAADASNTAAEATRKQLADLEQQMKKILEGENADEAAVLAIVEKMAPLKLEMEKSMVKNNLLIRKTLTAEQITKIKGMTPQHGKGMSGEGSKGGKGCGGCGSRGNAPAKDAPAKAE